MMHLQKANKKNLQYTIWRAHLLIIKKGKIKTNITIVIASLYLQMPAVGLVSKWYFRILQVLYKTDVQEGVCNGI